MAKLSPMKEEKAQPKQKNALPDTIIFTESPYYIASEELSEPEIRERDLPQYASSQSDDLDYEELKREIQQRGERMIKNIELAFSPEEDF